MSTILQKCFESQFIETTTVKLKFAPQKCVEFSRSHPCSLQKTAAAAAAAATDAMEHREKCHQLATKTDLCGLSFQQVLANICPSPKETIEKETVYIHPLSKRSLSSRLSEKSFEMCTENLGSETGTDIMDSSILSLTSSTDNSPREKSFSSSSSSISAREYSRNKVTNYSRNSNNFPPPLTTISGANSLQVRPHREGGRLVIRAIETPSKHTYLRAERSNGRLRLSLLKDYSSDFDLQVMTAEENNEIIESDEEEEEEEDEIDVVEENESYIDDEDLGENDQEFEDYDEDDEGDAQIMMCNRDMDGNSFDIEVEMGMEKFQRLSRCSEGGHNSNRVLYKPLWVATS